MSLSEISSTEELLNRIYNAKDAIDAIKGRDQPAEILVHPHPVLSAVAEPIDFDEDSFEEIVALVRQMGITLASASYGGKLGIAAPQIGVSKRVIIVNGCVMVNPSWTPAKAPMQDVVEGCYSVPHRQFTVPRARYGWAKWYSVDGVLREFKLKGMDAIVFQHELSHLDGKCCVDIGIETESSRARVNSNNDNQSYEEVRKEANGEEGNGKEANGEEVDIEEEQVKSS